MTKEEARDTYIRTVDSIFPNSFRQELAEGGIQIGAPALLLLLLLYAHVCVLKHL